MFNLCSAEQGIVQCLPVLHLPDMVVCVHRHTHIEPCPQSTRNQVNKAGRIHALHMPAPCSKARHEYQGGVHGPANAAADADN